MPTWGVAAILTIVAWAVLALVPGAPVRGSNRWIFGVGAALIILGYIFLSQGPWDSVSSLTIAPILLVLGYCVFIPVSLIRKQPGFEGVEPAVDAPAETTPNKRGRSTKKR
jgi:hypothetical protein